MSDTLPPMIAGPMLRALRPRRKEASTRGPAGAAFAAAASRARPGAGWARGDAGPSPRRIEIIGRIWGRIAADSNTGPAAILGLLETDGGLMRQANPPGAEGRAMAMQDHIREVLAGIGENTDREGLLKTPKRGEKARKVLTRGDTQEPRPPLDTALCTGRYHEVA